MRSFVLDGSGHIPGNIGNIYNLQRNPFFKADIFLFFPRSIMSRFNVLSDGDRKLGVRIVYLRRVDLVSQVQLARDLGLTRNQLANIESGRVALRAGVGWQLCKIFIVSPHWLCTGEEPIYAPDMNDRTRAAAERFINQNANRLLREILAEPVFEKFGWTNTSENRNTQSDVKPEITMEWLMGEVRRLTEPAGMKAKLANYLNVPQARVSEWLAAKYSPSGKTVLRVLFWVQNPSERK